MVIKQVSGAAGAGAGGFAGGLFSSPTFIILGALAVILLFFQGDIRKAFGNLGKIDITLPDFPEITLPEFPTITLPEFPEFPELPDFGQIFEDFFNIFNGGEPTPEPPPAGVTETPIGPVTTPEGCTVDPVTGIIECPTPPTFDVCDQFPELCEPCGPNEERIGGICRPISFEEPEPPFDEPEPFQPPIELPPEFEFTQPDPEGQFGGGAIFERDPCFMTLNEIINAGLADSASAAANLKAIACSANVTEEPSDFPIDFDFGTNIGEPTLESEEKKAACVSCQLFGLNCPICSGTL